MVLIVAQFRAEYKKEKSMKDTRYKVAIKSAINTLAILIVMEPEKIIDLMTGWAWDEEEASELKDSDTEFDIMKHFIEDDS
jgi:hypothetical protein